MIPRGRTFPQRTAAWRLPGQSLNVCSSIEMDNRECDRVVRTHLHHTHSQLVADPDACATEVHWRKISNFFGFDKSLCRLLTSGLGEVLIDLGASAHIVHQLVIELLIVH